MTSSEQKPSTKLPAYFDKYPEVRDKLAEYLKTVTPKDRQQHVENFKKYLDGELTWGEIRHISKRLQKEIARVAYMKFKMADYEKAESLFKGLAIIDHTNSYYRIALGAVFQKQKKYNDAVIEYSAALALKENDSSCLTNRGECFLMLGEFDKARNDLQAVLSQPLPAANPWLMRAKIMMKRLALLEKRET